MKKLIILVTSTCMLALSSPTIAEENLSIPEVETKMLNACTEDKDNTEAECKCVVKALKTELPSEHYDVLMNFLSSVMSDNSSGLWNFVWNNDISLKDLKEHAEALEKAGDRIEKMCGGKHINFDMDI